MVENPVINTLDYSAVHAADYVHGALELATGSDGWVRPSRFLAAQRRALSSCLAWHPGVYRQMASTTAGVCIRFVTDATRIALAVRMDAEAPAVAEALREVRRRESSLQTTRLLDGVSVVVDGDHRGVVEPRNAIVFVDLIDPVNDPVAGVVALPGLGKKRHVALWLPSLHGCEVRELWTNGTCVEQEPARPRLLVLGDATAQGFCCMDPAGSWPARLAEAHGLELVNQGMGRLVFQPSAIVDAHIERVEEVVVALGASYRTQRCDVAGVSADMRQYFAEVARHWPKAKVWALTPLWCDDKAAPVRQGSCFDEVPALVREAATRQGAQVIDGLALLPHRAELLADGAEYPDASGHAQIANRLLVTMDVADKTATELGDRALAVLDATPLAIPVAEVVRRGLGEVRYASPECVLVSLAQGGHMLYVPGPDAGLALTVCEMLAQPACFDALGEGLGKLLEESFGLEGRKPHHVCVYMGSRSLEMDAERVDCLQSLDASFAEELCKRSRAMAALGQEAVEHLLETRGFTGAFANHRLVGFVGERQDGSMWLPEVFGGGKKGGWDEVLEAAQINAHLLRGETPWVELYPQNKNGLRLQRKLGLVVLPASMACYL